MTSLEIENARSAAMHAASYLGVALNLFDFFDIVRVYHPIEASALDTIKTCMSTAADALRYIGEELSDEKEGSE